MAEIRVKNKSVCLCCGTETSIDPFLLNSKSNSRGKQSYIILFPYPVGRATKTSRPDIKCTLLLVLKIVKAQRPYNFIVNRGFLLTRFHCNRLHNEDYSILCVGYNGCGQKYCNLIGTQDSSHLAQVGLWHVTRPFPSLAVGWVWLA